MALSATSIVIWIVFIIMISLLFFAAFGNSKYSEDTIDEYMANLINEEQKRGSS
tara:strand:- start:631 stop:792 length:162 start_codon:yes stop_codon:yes gene_type:complete